METFHLTRLQAEIDRRRELLAAEADRRRAMAPSASGATQLGAAEVDGPGHALRIRLGAAFVLAGEALLARDAHDDPCTDAVHQS